MSAPGERVFLAPEAVAALLGDPALRLLEVRHDRDGRGDPGPSRHLPGAVAVEVGADLADPDAPASAGRRPLPAPAVLQERARSWGLGEDSTVVVYDDRGGRVAARAWWVLRWAGVRRVAVLDGGLAAWLAGGHPTGDLARTVPEGDLVVRPGGLPELDADAAAGLAAHDRLLDARDAAAYEQGHIPGARSLPSTRALDAGGRLRPAPELRALYGVSDGGPVPGLSCGGGVAGAFGVAVLAHLGIEAPLYVGSFSAWSAARGPVAVGAAAGGGAT